MPSTSARRVTSAARLSGASLSRFCCRHFTAGRSGAAGTPSADQSGFPRSKDTRNFRCSCGILPTISAISASRAADNSSRDRRLCYAFCSAGIHPRDRRKPFSIGVTPKERDLFEMVVHEQVAPVGVLGALQPILKFLYKAGRRLSGIHHVDFTFRPRESYVE
jgi:hypothetical protein